MRDVPQCSVSGKSQIEALGSVFSLWGSWGCPSCAVGGVLCEWLWVCAQGYLGIALVFVYAGS